MSKSVLPKTIYLFSNDRGEKRLEKNIFSIPENIGTIEMDGKRFVGIWTSPKKDVLFRKAHKGGLIAVDRDGFVFNALMIGVDVDFFFINPNLDGEGNLLLEGNLLPLNDPFIFRSIIEKGLDQTAHSQKNAVLKEIDRRERKTLSEIQESLAAELIDNMFSNIAGIFTNTVGKQGKVISDAVQSSNKRAANFTKEHVFSLVGSWEARHDNWVQTFLADAILSNASTLQGIKADLRNALLNDWRASLAFLLDRTTYQSRKDVINERTARYLFKTVLAGKKVFRDDSLDDIVSKVITDKIRGDATHIREKQDIRRLNSICAYLKNSSEKNITKTVLSCIEQESDPAKFLTQFEFIGDKTASFYMKFVAWIFDLNVEPIVVDMHVFRSLNRYGLIVGESKVEAKKAIRQLADQLGLPLVKVETALYEESWLCSNSIP